MPVNTYTETYILVHLLHLLHALHALVREIIPNTIHTYFFHRFSSIVRLRLRAFGAQTPSELVIAYLHGMIQSQTEPEALPFISFCAIVCLLN